MSKAGRDRSCSRDIGLWLYSPEPECSYVPGYSVYSATGGMALALLSVYGVVMTSVKGTLCLVMIHLSLADVWLSPAAVAILTDFVARFPELVAV